MAQTQIYSKRAQVQVKAESTVDTYIAPTGDGVDMFLAQEVSYSVDSSNWTPQYARGDYISGDEVPGSASATITFSVPIHGSGAAGTPPEFGTAIQACGFDYTNAVSTSDIYTPNSTFDGASGNPAQSYSVTILMDGLRYALKGGFGNLTFSANVDQPAVFTFTFQGGYVPVADDALEVPTYDITIPPAYRGASVVLNIGGAYGAGGVIKGIEDFSFDVGNNISIGKDVKETHGTYGARIVGRQTTGSFTPEMVLVATHDPFGDWRAGTSGSTFTTGAIGTTAGNICTISMLRIVLRPPTISDRNGIQAIEIPWALSAAATVVEGTGVVATSDLAIAFT